MSGLERVRHASAIFSLAVSPDETLLACGGAETAPITVWDLAGGSLKAQLAGLPRQAHALAFSPDSTRLAAANLWGGLCVWSLADGRLLDTRLDTSGRRTRSLAYPAHRPRARRPILLSDSIFRPVQRAVAPNGKFIAVSHAGVRVSAYRTTTQIAHLEPARDPLAQTGVQRLAWSADSQWLALAGAGWVGAWRPFDPPPAFYALHMPSPESLEALAILSGARQVLFARGPAVLALNLPPTPRAVPLTPWQQFLRSVPPPGDPSFNPRRDWNWNVTRDGYEGVNTFGARLLWYSHGHNPHAGGAAAGQDFAAFLAGGPAQMVPEPILVEVCQAVQALGVQPA